MEEAIKTAVQSNAQLVQLFCVGSCSDTVEIGSILALQFGSQEDGVIMIKGGMKAMRGLELEDGKAQRAVD